MKETAGYTVVSNSEGVMSEIFYHTGNDWNSESTSPKVFQSYLDSQSFVDEFNGGENDLYVSKA